MYSADLGWFSVNTCIDSSTDDAWIAHRLVQIADGVPPNQLMSRWTFKTKDDSKFSYTYHLIAHIASYAFFLMPALISITPVGVRMMDYLFDKGQYFYSRIRNTQDLYARKKHLTQLFLTLAVAEERLFRQESLDQKLYGTNGKRKYPFHKPVQANTLNPVLLRQAIQKTMTSLSEEDLKTLLVATQVFPVCAHLFPRVHKKFTMETIKRCTGKITLPENLRFEGAEINAFIHTRCTIDLNSAFFVNVPKEALASLEHHNSNSKFKGKIDSVI